MIRLAIFLIAMGLLASPLGALTITMVDKTADAPFDTPIEDPNAVELMALANHAAQYWENIIEDVHNIEIRIRYDIFGHTSTKANATVLTEVGGRPTVAHININSWITWYYDQTPDDHSEFNMVQTLYRQLTNDQQTDGYAGSVPGVFENSLAGDAKGSAPAEAKNGADLYSLLLHEIGHAIGMSSQLSTVDDGDPMTITDELADGDFDIDPNLVNGADFDLLPKGSEAHLEAWRTLMRSGLGDAHRRLPSAADVLAVATGPDPGWTNIDLPRQDFLPGGTNNWNTASNWVGGQVPGAGDDAACRFGADVIGNILIFMSADDWVNNLLLSSATSLRTFDNELKVFNTVTIQHDGNLPIPELFIETNGELNADLVVVNGGDLDLSGGVADIDGDLILSDDVNGSQGNASGFGNVEVFGNLDNSGRITATDGGTLTFDSPQPNPWDLDGSNGQGEVFATTGHLNFATGAIADAYGGLMQINAPYSVNFGEPWEIDDGVLNLTGGNPQEALLSGGELTCTDGDINAAALARITASLNLSGTMNLTVFPFSTLTLVGITDISGGNVLLAANSTLDCEGLTGISGGDFDLADNSTLATSSWLPITGGTFTGTGGLRMDPGSLVTITDGMSIPLDVTNTGGNLHPGSGDAEITFDAYTQESDGTLTIDLNGNPASGDFDHLIVTGAAALDGELVIHFNAGGAAPGDTWKILSAGSVTGQFSLLNVNGLPGDKRLLKFETADGVYLQLAESLCYATWAANSGLVPPHDDLTGDPDHDGILNVYELLFGGDPLVPDVGLLPEVGVINVNGTDYLSITVRIQSTIVPCNIWLSAKRSTDLQSWSPVDVVRTDSGFDPIEKIETRRWRSTFPFNSLPREYLRLEAREIIF